MLSKRKEDDETGTGNTKTTHPTEYDWWSALETMYRIRKFELEAVELFRAGSLPGFLHPSVGQEAVATGFTLELAESDGITSTHRGHGHVIGKGASLQGMFAELYGFESGLCGGLGGSMHIMDRSKGILGANGIVGAGIPIACGAALAMQQENEAGVVVSFFGDGAVNTGAFHEGVNLAAIWQLPVVFVCENNMYAESTPFSSVLPTADLMPRASSYGIPGSVIDGNDMGACIGAARHAIDRARTGNGPSLIQADTYRWFGHHTGATGPYREDAEVEEWKKNRDPIKAFEAELTREELATRDEMESLVLNIAKEVEEAAESAATGERMSVERMGTLVYGPHSPIGEINE